MSLDRKYLVFALIYAALGMLLGIVMAATHNHSQFVTHAHVLLVGFVASLLYAIVYKLWLPGETRTLANVQFLVHQGGALLMMIGLGLLYGNFVRPPLVEPMLAVAAIAVLVAALLLLLLVLTPRLPQATSSP